MTKGGIAARTLPQTGSLRNTTNTPKREPSPTAEGGLAWFLPARFRRCLPSEQQHYSTDFLSFVRFPNL